MTPIDIIIPVYRGLDETRACIESVLAAGNARAVEVIVIDDASPEPALARYLDSLPPAVTLVRNLQNLGFVATCNLAMAMHPDRDVVLLNADTVVPAGWLDRLAACAGPGIASVTPFSNNATLCSYPRIASDNAMSPAEAARIDVLAAQANAGRTVPIPTGVGFCMLMTRAALNAVGPFDVTAFGRGYGEENDWCRRAAQAGFGHVLCAGLFVYHAGAVSFGASSPAKRLAQAVMDERHPGYRALIAGHLDDDPARPLRRRIDLARLAASPRPRVLHAGAPGGDVARHIDGLAALFEGDLESIRLARWDHHSQRLAWLRTGEEFAAWLPVDGDQAPLRAMLDILGVDRLHLHLGGDDGGVIDRIAAVWQGEIDITLHDTLPGTRSQAARWLPRAARCFATSRSVAVAHGGGQRIEDLSPLPLRPPPVLRKVAVPGNLWRDEDVLALQALAADAARRRLPLRFEVLGSLPASLPPEIADLVTVAGSRADEALDTALALARADACWLAGGEDARDYILALARRAGLPVVTQWPGASSDRKSRLLPADTPTSAINDALMELSRPALADVPLPSWRGAYLAPIRRAGTVADAATCPDTFWRGSRPEEAFDALPMSALFERGVAGGDETARRALKVRVSAADAHRVTAIAEIEAAGQRIHDLNHALDAAIERAAIEAARLTAERDEARAAHAAVVASTSWRITAPLRDLRAWWDRMRGRPGTPD